MSFKAIVFDLDGTLLNTLYELGNITNLVLEQYRFPTHEINAYRFFVGEGVENLIRRVLPEGYKDKKTVNDCLSLFLKLYNKHLGENVSLYDGITTLLDGLTKAGIKLSILSNKPHDLTVKNVGQFLSNWNFEIILGQKQKIPKKPDPAGAIEIINRLNIDPSAFIYLGDTAVDMKTAVSAGMFPIGALWGFRDKQELENSGAKALVKHPVEVLNFIKMH